MFFANFIYECSVFMLILCFLVVLVYALFPIKSSKQWIMVLFNTIIVSLAIFSFFAEPNQSADLKLYYEHIDALRYGYQMGTGDNVLVVWRAILHIISWTGNNGWLPALCILLWGFFIGKVLEDYLKNNLYKSQAIMLYFIALFGGCSVYHLISVLRCPLVCAMMIYAFYFYRHKNIKKYIAYVIIASFIHVFALMLAIIFEIYEYLIKKRKNYSISKMLVVVGLIAVFINTNLFSIVVGFIPGEYGELLASKVAGYMEYTVTQGSLENTLRLLWLAFALLNTIILMRYKKGEISLATWLVFCSIALSSMTIFFERMMYIIAIASFSIINETTMLIKGKLRILYTLVSYIVYFVLCFVMLYIMFAHTTFNGNSYYEFWSILKSFIGG